MQMYPRSLAVKQALRKRMEEFLAVHPLEDYHVEETLPRFHPDRVLLPQERSLIVQTNKVVAEAEEATVARITLLWTKMTSVALLVQL
jgi:hypothetical protein